MIENQKDQNKWLGHLKKCFLSFLMLTLFFSPALSSAEQCESVSCYEPISCDEENSSSCHIGCYQLGTALVLGTVAGFAGGAINRGRKGHDGCQGKKGCQGRRGLTGTTGPVGPGGPVGPPGPPLVVPTGPAAFTFTFENIINNDAVNANLFFPDGITFIPSLVLPDGTIVTGEAVGENQTIVISIPAPAQIGIYHINLFLSQNPCQFSITRVTVTNSLSAAVSVYTDEFLPNDSVGSQLTYEFLYSPALIP